MSNVLKCPYKTKLIGKIVFPLRSLLECYPDESVADELGNINSRVIEI